MSRLPPQASLALRLAVGLPLILVAVAAVVALLAGCAGPPPEAVEAGQGTPVSTAPEPPEESAEGGGDRAAAAPTSSAAPATTTEPPSDCSELLELALDTGNALFAGVIDQIDVLGIALEADGLLTPGCLTEFQDAVAERAAAISHHSLLSTWPARGAARAAEIGAPI